MIEKLSNSWKLFKASLAVLSSDKELMIFPILSSLGTIIITLSFALPFILGGFFDTAFMGKISPFVWMVTFAFYVVQYCVVFFANTALVGAAHIRLQGGDPTVGDGFRIAGSRFGPILGYALIAATVGVIMQIFNRKSKGFGRLIVSLVGFAWNIATYLVVPVLAIEGIGPIEAIKRSVSLLKATWGEQLAGNYGLGLIFGIAYFVVFAVSLPIIILALSQQLWVMAAVLFVIFLIVLVLMGLLNASLTGIYSAAVYEYAVSGKTSAFFEKDMVTKAFQG